MWLSVNKKKGKNMSNIDQENETTFTEKEFQDLKEFHDQQQLTNEYLIDSYINLRKRVSDLDNKIWELESSIIGIQYDLKNDNDNNKPHDSNYYMRLTVYGLMILVGVIMIFFSNNPQ